MEYFFIWIVCGPVAAVVASSKGRSFGGWLVLGLLFGIFALLAVGFMPAVEKTDAALLADEIGQEPLSGAAPEVIAEYNRRKLRVEWMAGERACPHCAEPIKRAAKVCKHCGRDVDPAVYPGDADPAAA